MVAADQGVRTAATSQLLGTWLPSAISLGPVGVPIFGGRFPGQVLDFDMGPTTVVGPILWSIFWAGFWSASGTTFRYHVQLRALPFSAGATAGARQAVGLDARACCRRNRRALHAFLGQPRRPLGWHADVGFAV